MKLIILIFVMSLAVNVFANKWSIHEASLRIDVVKIKSLEDTRDKLLKEKSVTRDNQRLDEIIRDLTANHKELEKAYDEFNKEREHIRFEHPEQGDTMERKYRRYRLKSVEERQEEMGLDGKLNALKTKVEKTYGMKKYPRKATSEVSH